MLKILALLLSLVLMCPTALADGVKYPATQALLQEMQERDVLCLPDGLDAEGREWAVMQASDSSGRTWDIRFGFDRAGHTCLLRVPGFISFHEMEMVSVLRVCNSLNADYRFVRFHVEGDCTVTATMLLRFDQAAPGPLTAEAATLLTEILVDVYPQLVEFHL